jgi:YbgC/YbaW family acyl-CoA thioester hydrolase
MQRKDFRFFDRLRVRWAEIDAQQIVFNGHYLMYFDTAIAGYWRALAMPYAQTLEQLGGDLYVRKAAIEYEASARYDDVLDIGLRCARIGTSSIQFLGAAFRQQRRLVTCELLYVYADPRTQTAQPVPDVLRTVLQSYEAGASMLEVGVGTWHQLGEAARAIRSAVFIGEQRIPADLEWDTADADAVHAVARNRFGAALATGRLLPAHDGIARIGRMAALPAVRGAGVGRAVLRALMDAARARGDCEIRLHAQTSAQAFYAREGFSVAGSTFEEAGIPHIEMARML